MKPGIHPNYREVVFQDMSNDFKFVSRSTIQTKETTVFEGKEYPWVKLEVSSESHPFYTGNQKILDSTGRVDKFRRKYATFGSGSASADSAAAASPATASPVVKAASAESKAAKPKPAAKKAGKEA